MEMKLKLANNIMIESEALRECTSLLGSVALAELLTKNAIELAEIIVLEERRKNNRMNTILLIDDMRNETSLEALGHVTMPTRTVRTYDEAIKVLSTEGPFDLVYLDHDLGEDEMAKTGYGIMNFLEANTQFLPGKIILVTSNPVGRRQMQTVIEKLYK